MSCVHYLCRECTGSERDLAPCSKPTVGPQGGLVPLPSLSTVEDIQSLICRQLGSTEDGSGCGVLARRVESSGGHDSAGNPGKSEWCCLPGSELFRTRGGQRRWGDQQFLRTFPSPGVLGRAWTLAVQHLSYCFPSTYKLSRVRALELPRVISHVLTAALRPVPAGL